MDRTTVPYLEDGERERAVGNEMRYRQDTIESLGRSKVSLMPEGLLQQLTRDEIRDLLAFLQGLK